MRQLKISQQITYRNENSVNRYLQEVNKYPLISVDEEVELTCRIHKGDRVALQKLVEANLRFVISVAKRYQNQGLSFADLINEGNVGLVKAAGKFDETRGFKFISYAVWWIRQSIIQALSEQTRVVRLPLNRLASIKLISKANNFLEQQLEREPTNDEIADYLDQNECSIAEINGFKQRQVSLDKPLSNNNESDFTLYDKIETDSIHAPDNNLLLESRRIDLFRAMKKLTEREFDIISKFYGLNNSDVYSLQEIALEKNMSSERIRQIRNSGLLKIKKIMSGKTCFLDNA